MCLVFEARAATPDVDAIMKPASIVREAAVRVAASQNVSATWLNDAVKGLIGKGGSFDDYVELPNLRVYVASADYMLAMKCASMRLGAEFHDLDDVRYLLRYLNVTAVAEALEIAGRYPEESQLHPKTRLALEELLPRR